MVTSLATTMRMKHPYLLQIISLFVFITISNSSIASNEIDSLEQLLRRSSLNNCPAVVIVFPVDVDEK